LKKKVYSAIDSRSHLEGMEHWVNKSYKSTGLAQGLELVTLSSRVSLMAVSPGSIAVGRAGWKERAVGPRVVDAAGDLRKREQLGAQCCKARAVLRDRLHPVGVEQARRRRAGDEADV